MKTKTIILIILIFVTYNIYAQNTEIFPTVKNYKQKAEIPPFEFNTSKIKIFASDDCKTATYFHSILEESCKDVLPLLDKNQNVRSNYDGGIIFILTGIKNLGKDGYIIDINNRRITIEANEESGFMNAVQVLWQLIGHNLSIETKQQSFIKYIEIKTYIESCRIEDYTSSKERNINIDCFTEDCDINLMEQYLDFMAMNKINKIYWYISQEMYVSYNKYIDKVIEYAQTLNINLILAIKESSNDAITINEPLLDTNNIIEFFVNVQRLWTEEETKNDKQFVKNTDNILNICNKGGLFFNKQ